MVRREKRDGSAADYNLRVMTDSSRQRARIIAALGPGIFLFALAWTALRLVFGDPALTFRALIFAPPHQLMVVGLIVSLLCIPVAREVAVATPEELALPGFEVKVADEPEAASVVGPEAQKQRRSYQGLN
jgi:hypothetical protein